MPMTGCAFLVARYASLGALPSPPMGIACMVAIANLQYGWTLFVDPINQ
jgi:hypothetical protein